MKSTMKVDARIRQITYDAVSSKHRALFMIIGDNAKKQIPLLHHTALKAGNRTADILPILWLYKEDRGTCSRKQLKQLQRKINCGQINFDDNDPFDLFLASNIFHFCHYNDTQRVLGQTYAMCILQDFSALTPNMLARAIETVCGGGLIIFLLPSIQNLHQVFEMSMDVHSHYRTESHPNVKARFNRRFILSLANCPNAVITDDHLNILLISAPDSAVHKEVVGCDLEEILRLSDSLEGEEATRQLGPLLKCCRTLDQAVAVTKFIRALSNRASPSTVVTTAARGRGKSAALGLGLAAAVALGFSRILVTAPGPESVSTLFEFLCQGLNILGYETHQHYEVERSDLLEFSDAVVSISIFKQHPQLVKYIQPSCSDQLGQPDIVCVDEAAAIPLPVLKKLIGPYFVFMSSTINGYEGTGRSLSLKLINDMRQQSTAGLTAESNFSSKHQQHRKATPDNGTNVNRLLCEVSLQQPIRYSDSDPVEKWLYDVLCLDVCSNLLRFPSTFPPPAQCQLFYVQRDTLFSYNRKTEEFLKHLVAIYVSSHYKNSPNDLQLLADAPAHHIFCLLGPDAKHNELPEIFCVLQVAFEGKLSVDLIQRNLERGERASGDMIPWTIEQQFDGHNFARKSGLRVVRIATHPEYQRMGYGSRALQLLQNYFEGKIPRLTDHDVGILDSDEKSASSAEVTSLLNEMMKPQTSLPPLLVALGHRAPESLDYFGVSFGITPELLKFWRKFGMLAVYVRQTSNDLTGEHSCIMVKSINSTDSVKDEEWLKELWTDFRKRFLRLLSHDFRSWRVSLAYDLLHHQRINISVQHLSSFVAIAMEEMFITQSDLSRLEKYSNNLVDYRLIKDLVQPLASLYFCRHLDLHLNAIKSAILLGIGLQGKSIDDLVVEFNSKERKFSAAQVLAILSQTVRSLLQSLRFCSQKAKEKDNLHLEQSREQTSPMIKEIPDESDDFDKNQLQRKRKYNGTKEKDEQNKWKSKRTL